MQIGGSPGDGDLGLQGAPDGVGPVLGADEVLQLVGEVFHLIVFDVKRHTRVYIAKDVDVQKVYTFRMTDVPGK